MSMELTSAQPTSPLIFVVSILPNLFSPPTSIKPLPLPLLSNLLRLSHRFLDPLVDSAEYYQIATPANEEVERRRKALVGKGFQHYLNSNDLTAEWRIDESEGIMSRVGLGGLAVIVKWEMEQKDEGSTIGGKMRWTYFTLEIPTTSSSTYFPSFPAAMDQFTSTLDKKGRRSPPIDIDLSKSKVKSVDEMAQGEGTTPGAYGAAEDFWSGWNSDEGKEKGNNQDEEDEYDSDEDNPTGFCLNAVNASRSRYDIDIPARSRYQEQPQLAPAAEQDEQENNNSYWNSYGSDNNSAIGDDYQQVEERHSRLTASATANAGVNEANKEAEGRPRSSTLRPTFDRQVNSGASTPKHPIPPVPLLSHLHMSPSEVALAPLSDVTTSVNQLSSTPYIPHPVGCLGKDGAGIQVDLNIALMERREEEAIEVALAGIWRLYNLRPSSEADHETKKLRFIALARNVCHS
jgi:hypothetical protein